MVQKSMIPTSDEFFDPTGTQGDVHRGDDYAFSTIFLGRACLEHGDRIFDDYTGEM